MKPPRRQFLARFGYVGAGLHGVQPQPGYPTVGSKLTARLCDAHGERPRALCFAARTDAGVHAQKNLATFFLRGADIDAQALADAVALHRDDGLVDVRLWETPISVHARGISRGKRYRYIVDDNAGDADCPPHPFAWRISPLLAENALVKAASHLVGTHDFSSFRGSGCSANTPVKTLTHVRIGGPFPLEDGSRRWFIVVVGDAFLRKMIRNLVGLLVEVGTGLRAPDDVKELLAARDRRALGITAPPGGLTLLEVGAAWPEDQSARIWEHGVAVQRASAH